MSTVTPGPYQGSSSSPQGFSIGSGAGSIAAVLTAQGVVVQRHTPQGSTKPFGSDTGSADDNSFTQVKIPLPEQG